MQVITIQSAIVTGCLMVAIGWFALRADPLGGEPHAMIEIDPLTRPAIDAPITDGETLLENR